LKRNNITFYNPNSYWNKRLTNNLDKNSIGYSGLGNPFNYWLYKKRGKVFLKIVKSYESLLKLPKAKVADLGCGNGFYVNIWQRLGIKDLVGIDIASESIQFLSKEFPEYIFLLADICDPNFILQERFAIISIFDVLFHITDDNSFIQAVKNISSLIQRKGILLISDCIFDEERYDSFSSPHFKARSIQFYSKILSELSFKIIDIKKVFSIMHPWVIFPKNKIVRFIVRVYNWIFTRVLKSFPFLGYILGPVLYYMDILLDLILPFAPANVIIVIQKES
jgi:2-polyprenyl-3-methyl-5-hydroxy-6-metoxy-1,4-benzoquinol methylase